MRYKLDEFFQIIFTLHFLLLFYIENEGLPV